MPRITQQTLIALYGEVLTMLEVVELAHDQALDVLTKEEPSPAAMAVLQMLADSRTLAQRSCARAVDTMLDRFPKMELHPLTGDVLDPPQV